MCPWGPRMSCRQTYKRRACLWKQISLFHDAIHQQQIVLINPQHFTIPCSISTPTSKQFFDWCLLSNHQESRYRTLGADISCFRINYEYPLGCVQSRWHHQNRTYKKKLCFEHPGYLSFIPKVLVLQNLIGPGREFLRCLIWSAENRMKGDTVVTLLRWCERQHPCGPWQKEKGRKRWESRHSLCRTERLPLPSLSLSL